MALKSGVFACLILALCVGCNNVMAQNTDLKETEKSAFMCEVIGEIKGRSGLKAAQLTAARTKFSPAPTLREAVLSCVT